MLGNYGSMLHDFRRQGRGILIQGRPASGSAEASSRKVSLEKGSYTVFTYMSWFNCSIRMRNECENDDHRLKETNEDVLRLLNRNHRVCLLFYPMYLHFSVNF